MKTQKTTGSYARLLAAAFIIAGGLTTAQAQDTAKTVNADIHYAGTVNNQLLFGVEYNNEAIQPFTVEVKDGDGYVFFNGRFKDKKFRKFFALDKTELEKGSITIQVVTKDGVQMQAFDINTTSRFVQDVNVSVVKL